MCYKEASLDLEGVHLACLSGDNGAGKSSILEAITWALWGKARAGDDDLISQGEIESEVDFVFSVAQNQYRVNRRRTKKGAGQTALNFYAKKPDGSWNNIGETGVRAIQEQIIKTVRTKYDTFINSAFLLQGRADSFTVKTPGERKKVLAEILELNQYDEYEKQAKEQAKEADGRRKELDEELKRLLIEINRRPESEHQKEEAETLLEAGRNPLRRQEENLTNLKTRQAQLQSSEQKLSEAR
jgi:exonuclease SbcC